MAVPRTPEAFFETYVPSRLAEIAEGLTGRSSPGSVVCQIGDRAWAVRLHEGIFQVEAGNATDAVIRIALEPDSFEPLFIRAAERDELATRPHERRRAALRALTLDGERARLVRGAPGALELVVSDQARSYRVVATPGGLAAGHKPTCTVRLGLDELSDLQAGRAHPLQLMMTGQLVIEGDAQLVMNLAAALSS